MQDKTEVSATPRRGPHELNLNIPPEALQDGAHCVHSHTATREFCRLIFGAQAGNEDQLRTLVIMGRRKMRTGPSLKFAQVQALAVIFIMYREPTVLNRRSNTNGSVLGFADGPAILGTFQTMIQTVAHEVGENPVESGSAAFLQDDITGMNIHGRGRLANASGQGIEAARGFIHDQGQGVVAKLEQFLFQTGEQLKGLVT